MDTISFVLIAPAFVLIVGLPVVAYLFGRFDHKQQRKSSDRGNDVRL